MSTTEVPSLEKLLSFKLSELKKALKAKSLSSTGTKAELAERLHMFHVTAAEEARLLDGNEPNEAELLGELEDVSNAPPIVETDVKVAAAIEPSGKSLPAKASKVAKPTKTAGKRKAAAAKPVIPPTTASSEAKESSSEKGVSDTNESIEKPPVEPVKVQSVPDKDPIEPPPVPKKPVTSLSDEDRKRLRGERFSTHLSSTNEDMEARKRARAERFGLTYIPPKTATSRGTSDISGASLATGDLSRMEKRAARFGEVVAPSLRVAREEETKVKRMERFGGDSASALKSSGSSQSDEEKRKRRQERFGIVEADKKTSISSDEDTERKKRRLERFGGATTEKSTPAQSETLEKRAKRFGLVDDDAKKAARALRFGVSS